MGKASPFPKQRGTRPKYCRLAERVSFTCQLMFVERRESNSHNFPLTRSLQS